ncbi:MAG: TIR domain-containing protein [Steroidobacteraceae bacterium]
MSGIFISYRRSDNPDATGRIYDRLVAEFGKPKVFKDIDSIPLGMDFRGHLNEIVGGCTAVLAIIGPSWADTRSNAGQRRLEDPDDFVRIELEAALARGIPVVPVLVGNATMPGVLQLPATLSELAYRQSIQVRPDPDFHNDATRLVVALRAIIDPNAPQVEPAPTRPGRSRVPLLATLAAAATLAAIAFAIPAVKHLRETPPPEIRTEIVTPPTENPGSFALSPDGLQVAYVAMDGGTERLWLRSLASSTARPLPGTEGAAAPFWSPDSKSIGYFASGALKRHNLSDMVSQTLGVGTTSSTGTWNSDGDILFVVGAANPVLRISANGGAVTPVTQLNAEHVAHRLPMFLPDGRHFVFVNLAGTAPGIYLGSLDGGTPVRLKSDIAAFSVGAFAHLPGGWLVWSQSGALVAQRLDITKAALVGEPVTIANSVGTISASSTGLLAYRSINKSTQVLAWKDRSGKSLGSIGEPDSSYNGPSVAPDGRVAVARTVQDKMDIWLSDGTRSSRITFDGARNWYPIWSHDGTRIVYASRASKASALYQKFTSGTGEAEQILSTDEEKIPSSWSPDGRYLLFFSANPATGVDTWILPMTGDRLPSVMLKTPFFEVWPRFSPDGKWVAYQSDESGRFEIYVRSFVELDGKGSVPSLGSGRWQVSTAGGTFPVWSPDGRELYFLNPAGEMIASSIKGNGAVVTPGTPVKLFATKVLGRGTDNATGRQYDVAPDGRFLINETMDSDTATLPITLIQNWNPDAARQ